MKKHIAALIAICTITCTFTACGHDEADEVIEDSQEVVTESTAETSETDEEEVTEETQTEVIEDNEPAEITDNSEIPYFDSYEAALESYFECLNNNDYETALKIMYPDNFYEMMKYLTENQGEDIKYIFENFWDEERPMQFKGIVSEEPLEEGDEALLSSMVSRMIYCADIFSEYDTQNNSYEQINDEINTLFDEMEKNSWDYPNYTDEVHRIKFALTDKHDIDFEFTSDVYLIDGEGWRIANVLEDEHEEWTNESGLYPLGKEIYAAAQYALLSAIADNVNEIGEKGFAEPCIVSNYPDYCYNTDNETVEKVCGIIADSIDDIDNCIYFIGIVDGDVADIVLCSIENTNIIRSIPTGIISCGDDYENASDLNFDDAYRLYLENLQN